MLKQVAVLSAVVAAATLSACAHAKAPVATAPPVPAPAPVAMAVPPAPPPAPPMPMACSADPQCAANQLCLDGRCAAITPSLSACSLARVHFDFDKDLLHPAEYPALQRMARCLQANQPSHVLIAGNADERGTVAYNLALGQRRAGAVRQYLVDLGVPARELELVTYGKELPLCTAHDEACWSQNRRAAIRPGAAEQDIGAKVKADEAREHHLASATR